MSYVLTDTALHTANITTGQTIVLAAIATFADVNGKAWPSIRAIAEITKQSIRTVQNHIASLLKLGFLKRIYRSGRSAITIITSRVTGVLTPVQTPANSAYPPLQILHPEEVIQSVNQITAHSQNVSVAAGADIIVFETKIPDSRTAAVPVQAIAHVQAVELPVQTASQTATPVPTPTETVDPFAGVEPQLIADFGIVRKTKKKAPAVTRTEAIVFAEQAEKAGLTVAQAVRECVLRGWARFEAGWLPAKPVETPTRLFKPEVVQLATPETISAAKADLTALRSKIGASADPLQWARDAIKRADAGERVGNALMRNARLALRI